MDINKINIIALAYLGDSIYEVYVRDMLIRKGIQKVELLQKEAVLYVSAKGQAKVMKYLMDNNLLNDSELEVFYRGRNNKRSNHPKNTDVITYKISTGFEAMIGYLYLSGKFERLKEILKILEVI